MDLSSIPFGLALITAFAAGIISFISPCVLPLIPAYVSYMGGRVTHQVSAQVTVGAGGQAVVGVPLSSRLNTLMHGIAFVAGFTFVFVTFGLLATAFIGIIGGSFTVVLTEILGRVGGIIIVFLGLHFMGVIPSIFKYLRTNKAILGSVVTTVVIGAGGSVLIMWGLAGTVALWDREIWAVAGWAAALALILTAVFLLWLVLGGGLTTPQAFWLKVMNTIELALYADTRRQMTATGKQGFLGSAFLGIVFSAGWTPCVGPVYGAALNLAISGTGANVAQAGILLTFYSLGLGIPFLLTTLLLDGAQGILRKLQRHMHKIELVSGAFLIFIGVIVASGQLQLLTQNLRSSQLADLSVQLEENLVDSFTGQNKETAPTSQDTLDDASVGSIQGLAETSGAVIGTEVGNIAPNFETISETGEPIKLSNLRGKVVLLNFWATWCGPCRVEMPEFQKAFKTHSDDGFTILAVNYGETAEDVAGFRKALGLTFPMGLDEQGAIQEQYGVLVYPSTYILDQNGVIIVRHFGPMTAQQIQEIMNSVLPT